MERVAREIFVTINEDSKELERLGRYTLLKMKKTGSCRLGKNNDGTVVHHFIKPAAKELTLMERAYYAETLDKAGGQYVAADQITLVTEVIKQSEH